VDEILVLSEEKLKYGKRTLRVQRCKSLPAKPKAAITLTGGPTPDLPPHLKVAPNSVLTTGSIPESFAPLRRANGLAAPRTVHKVVVPKGNPLLGEQIKDLSKDERKVVKSADAERMARRVAKKKARTALERGGGVSGGTGGMKERVKLDGGVGGAKGKKKPGVGLKAKKSRVRSSAAAKKVNHKKE
jgi:nucleolar protein 12